MGTDINIKVEGAQFVLYDILGNPLIIADDEQNGVQSGSVTTVLDAPHFVFIIPLESDSRDFRLRSNRRLAPYDDPDDGTRIKVGPGYLFLR